MTLDPMWSIEGGRFRIRDGWSSDPCGLANELELAFSVLADIQYGRDGDCRGCGAIDVHDDCADDCEIAGIVGTFKERAALRDEATS